MVSEHGLRSIRGSPVLGGDAELGVGNGFRGLRDCVPPLSSSGDPFLREPTPLPFLRPRDGKSIASAGS